MRNLRFISVLLLLFAFSSCASYIPEGFYKTNKEKSELSNLAIFVSSSSLQKYDISLDYKKTHFSGMMLIKKINESSCHLVLTSYLGLTIFNLEISKDRVLVHQCIEALNNKSLLNLFGSDIELLMGYRLYNKDNIKVYMNDKSDNIIEKVSNRYYTIDTKNRRLIRIQQRGLFGKRDVRFISDRKVEIIHPFIGLTLTINSLK